ncbi:MAG: glycerophosphodiester phosphodiesterase, partial [Algiphilus sp.]
TEDLISVALIGDDLEEDDEHFRLLLSSEEVALHRNHAIGTIANDDSACLPALPGTENPWLARRPISFAHRGGVIEFPENTLFAYHRAEAVGADVLEMDVYQTSDGALVVLHDLTVDRTTDGSGNVGDFTLAELKALDAAYWFVPGQGTTRDAPEAAYVYRGIATGERAPPAGFTANDFRIPTLEEALARFPDALLNIELKPDLDGTGSYEGQLARLLQAYGRDDDVMVASFDDSASALFELQNGCASTSVPLAQAAAVVLASKGPLPMLPPPGHQAFQVPIDTSSVSQIPEQLQIEVVTDDFIADAHNAGLAVHVWTIDDCPTMVDLLHRGVDGIMTDRPLRLAQVLAQPEGEWNCEGID